MTRCGCCTEGRDCPRALLAWFEENGALKNGAPEEALAAMLESILPLGCALAMENRLAQPASLQEALLAPLAMVWADTLPLLRSFLGDNAQPLPPVLAALEQNGGVGGKAIPVERAERACEMVKMWDYTHMKLTADYRGRLTSCELFTPNRTFSAEKQSDGSIRLVELVEKETPVVKLVSRNGHLYFPNAVGRDAIAAAVRAERDER